jgi:zinc D-Ala-D-Ala carboxypeptidase
VTPALLASRDAMPVWLSEHFSVAEFEASESAARAGLDNRLPRELLAGARATAAMLERVRAALAAAAGRECPVVITSGYRSPALNLAIGGVPHSDHTRARAADVLVPRFGPPAAVARALAPHLDALGIGQLALEFPSRGGWVHLSTRTPALAINRLITIDRRGTVPGLESVA